MQTTHKGGRPRLPERERKSKLHAFRLDADGEKQLARIKRALGTDGDTAAVRAALRALALQLGIDA